jgi:type IV pilus assembly protein PilQ
VNRIDFLGEKDGRSTLSIETTSPVDYNIQKVSDKLLELRLMKANIAEFRQRPMITTRFESAVNRIMPIQLPSMRDFSLFSIELREPVPYYVEQTGVLLLVHFEASSVPPAPADETNLPAWKKALEETIGSADMVSTYPKEIQATGGSPVTMGAKPAEVAIDSSFSPPSEIPFGTDQATVLTKSVKQYTGEKIALDFFQTDIKNVFRILREVSGKNFAIDEDVSGKVTLTLDKPVPWDQVMDLVLRMNQLGMIVEGDIVRIATLATLKQENDLRKAQIASSAKREGTDQSAGAAGNAIHSDQLLRCNHRGASPYRIYCNQRSRFCFCRCQKQSDHHHRHRRQNCPGAGYCTEQIDKVTSQVIIEARVVEVNESIPRNWASNGTLGVGPVSMKRG